MSNILQAIINIAENPVTALPRHSPSRNTMNNMGKALEIYIQDVFAGTSEEEDAEARKHRLSEVFSYLGNQNNPPDMMLLGGDAIEVKKLQTYGSSIALNSSYPKHKLHADDGRITDACKQSEEWDIKDIIYAVGVTNDTDLNHLWLVYGDCYAASREIYTRIGKKIKDGIEEIPNIELSETVELGRINRVDPLGITSLRMRGMWHIHNPLRVYDDIYQRNESCIFSLACLMRSEKFNTFDQGLISDIMNHQNIQIDDVEIKNPDNPVQLIVAKLIKVEVA
jgi:hypothetical protein